MKIRFLCAGKGHSWKNCKHGNNIVAQNEKELSIEETEANLDQTKTGITITIKR